MTKNTKKIGKLELKPCEECGGELTVVAHQGWQVLVIECKKCGKQITAVLGGRGS